MARRATSLSRRSPLCQSSTVFPKSLRATNLRAEAAAPLLAPGPWPLAPPLALPSEASESESSPPKRARVRVGVRATVRVRVRVRVRVGLGLR